MASRLVVIGDVHGNFEGWTRLLRLTGLVDAQHHWSGGTATLVMTGDVVGRGGYPKRIYLWIRRLMREARQAGGCIEFLLGNHEAMSMHHIHSYTTVQEYQDFAPRTVLDQSALRTSFMQMPPPDPAGGINNSAMLDMGHLQEEPLGWLELRRAFAPTGMVGRWLLERPSLLVIGSTLFVHGGLHPRYCIWEIDELNDRIRREMSKLRPYFELDPRSPAMAEDGPHWYRIAMKKTTEQLTREIEEIASSWNIDRMVVGHTPTFLIDPRAPGQILTRAGGRLMCVDVGIGHAYGGRLAALEIMPDGRTSAIYPDRVEAL